MGVDAVRVIALSGEYDVYSVDKLELELVPSLDLPYVVVDFSKVAYIDSTALSLMVKFRKRRAEKGFEPKRLAGLNASLRHVFKLTQLDTIWPLYEDVETAVGSF